MLYLVFFIAYFKVEFSFVVSHAKLELVSLVKAVNPAQFATDSPVSAGVRDSEAGICSRGFYVKVQDGEAGINSG